MTSRCTQDLEKALGLVDRVSNAVHMGIELGLKKCAVATVICGVLQEKREVVSLDENHSIPAVSEDDPYKAGA